ncbi:hypothetical protein M407DRAFT_33026 [Tulasnella calospora MUT 4182]|uniref:Uncharacterized protein n=1 Tax=Tulasnella calospora MUT 4182 TaxID=1051891 RepID=A0A0C3Q322_9AGAM|nr:hypothetical protein M407DRAFT_33026 [Tulasnella calospora MUT 4182]
MSQKRWEKKDQNGRQQKGTEFEHEEAVLTFTGYGNDASQRRETQVPKLNRRKRRLRTDPNHT